MTERAPIQVADATQARAHVLACDCPELRADLARLLNVDRVDVDADGDVFVGEPQPHWLSEAELVEAVNAIERGI